MRTDSEALVERQQKCQKRKLLGADVMKLIGMQGHPHMKAMRLYHESLTKQQFLMAAHAGASDCASAAGVMLEAARVLIANTGIQLAGPVIFLFNGAEETLSQAAHGFMAQSQ